MGYTIEYWPRQFSRSTVRAAFERQCYVCGNCGVTSYDYDYNFQAHHIRRYADGGSNLLSNCVILCEQCHSDVHDGSNYKKPIELPISSFKFFDPKCKKCGSKGFFMRKGGAFICSSCPPANPFK